jgi:hypothetical protein
MYMSHTRRSFLSTAAISSGVVCFGAGLGSAGDDEQELATVREQLSIKVQMQQARERAILITRLVDRYGERV